MERRLSVGAESTERLLGRLKDVLRSHGFQPLDMSLTENLRSKYRDEFGAEPHDDTVAWFNFAAEVNEPVEPGSDSQRQHRCPGQLIAPMMQPYTFDKAIQEMHQGFGYLLEDGPDQYEKQAFKFREDGRADFVLIGSDVTGFDYCLSPSSDDLGPPRLFFIGEGQASFFLQVPGAFDDTSSVWLHEDMPTLRLYLEALVGAYHERQLVISDDPFAQISPNTYYPWPNADNAP